MTPFPPALLSATFQMITMLPGWECLLQQSDRRTAMAARNCHQAGSRRIWETQHSASLHKNCYAALDFIVVSLSKNVTACSPTKLAQIFRPFLRNFYYSHRGFPPPPPGPLSTQLSEFHRLVRMLAAWTALVYRVYCQSWLLLTVSTCSVYKYCCCFYVFINLLYRC